MRVEYSDRQDGPLHRCTRHDWVDTRHCPQCLFAGTVGGDAKVTKCLYDCIRDGFDVHGGPLGHVGVVRWIGYLQDKGYFKDGVVGHTTIGAIVKCPLTNIGSREIIALEVADVTAEEYQKVLARK